MSSSNVPVAQTCWQLDNLFPVLSAMSAALVFVALLTCYYVHGVVFRGVADKLEPVRTICTALNTMKLVT